MVSREVQNVGPMQSGRKGDASRQADPVLNQGRTSRGVEGRRPAAAPRVAFGRCDPDSASFSLRLSRLH